MLTRKSLILSCLISLLLRASEQLRDEYDNSGGIDEGCDFHEEEDNEENFAENEEGEMEYDENDDFEGMYEEYDLNSEMDEDESLTKHGRNEDEEEL
ncbi:hypothetical protein ACTXT7_009447 [Hymenolepis weldensis]